MSAGIISCSYQSLKMRRIFQVEFRQNWNIAIDTNDKAIHCSQSHTDTPILNQFSLVIILTYNVTNYLVNCQNDSNYTSPRIELSSYSINNVTALVDSKQKLTMCRWLQLLFAIHKPSRQSSVPAKGLTNFRDLQERRIPATSAGDFVLLSRVTTDEWANWAVWSNRQLHGW